MRFSRALCAPLLALLATAVLLPAGTLGLEPGAAPNVVFVLADDLGWNDVSLHGSPQIPTPHIDALARSGVELDRYYVNAVCSPTRASLLTGRSVIHHGVFLPFGFGNDAEGLNLSYTLLPQHLKREYGYHNYMIGKWHLGMKTAEYQPTARGFDKYFGYYDGCTDYWNHRSYGGANGGKDLHEGGSAMGVVPERLASDFAELDGQYSTFVYSAKAAEWIGQHAKEHAGEPMFMYVAFQAMHSANNRYVQAPREYLDRFAAVDPEGRGPCGQYEAGCTAGQLRRTVAATVSAMDDAVGQIAEALRAAGMWDNTIVVFSSDNGGPVGTNANMANNFPLRGGKAGYFEGGVRAVGLVRGPGTGAARVSRDLFHVSDWAPSILTAVKRAVTGDPEARHEMSTGPREVGFRKGDGVDNWDAISRGLAARSEIIHVAQAPGSPLRNHAIRSGGFKLVWNADPIHRGWAPPPGLTWNYTTFTVKCPEPPKVPFECTEEDPCLFQVEDDPCEHRNVAAEHPDLVRSLQAAIEEYRKTTVLPWNGFAKLDPRADPALHDDSYVPWMDPAEDSIYYPTNYSGPGY
eukprot:m51a1_g14279 hypothetical protein (576) ;mRNA; r:358637-360720